MSTDRNAFRAILWKEFRENLKWAVLGLLFVSVGVIYILLRLLNRASNGGDLNWADLSFSLFWLTPILTSVVGLMIGLAQVVLENRGDQWGFLTHRPMRRSTLFWGKVVAGILLYTAAVGVPLTCGLLWMGIPGHLPMPFDARLVLPVIADVLCGLVYYFAGLLTGMRDARWYASRVMGIGAGIVCSIALSLVPEFWQAVGCCLLGIFMTSASAWGAFVEGGRFESQPPMTRFATSVTIAAGLLITGFIIYGVAVSFSPALVFNSRITRYTVAGDGTIVRTVYDDDAIVEVQDLQGKPLERYSDPESRRALTHGVVATQPISAGVRRPWNGDYRNTSEFFRPFVSSDLLSNGASFTWYYIPRLDRMAAYDNRSAKLVGWMGPGGFTGGADVPEDHFEHPLMWSTLGRPELLTFKDAVYRLDLYHRHIEKIFTTEAGESVIGASDSHVVGSYQFEFGENARFVAISTTKRVVVQSRDGKTQLSAALDSKVAEYVSVQVYRTLASANIETLIWYNGEKEMPAVVSRFGSSNSAVAQYTFPRLFRPGTLSWGYVMIRSIMDSITSRIVLRKHSIWETSIVQVSNNQRIVSWVIPIMEGVLFAALAFARGRRYAFPAGRLGLWTAIGFGLGPLGFALMMSLLEWPAFEKCPSCGRSRVVTRDHCEHCSNPFTPPFSDGTEVFEPITSS